MSIHAIALVFDQDIRPSSLKFVLVAFADCANEKDDMKCWPSMKHVCAITSQDRKTVLDNVSELIRLGWLIDTGERRGQTKQVKVYRLCVQESKSAENGTVKRVPFFQSKSPVFPIEESRKRDTEPLIEPLIEPVETTDDLKIVDKNETADGDPHTWCGEILPYGWCSYAEKLGITDDQIYRSWKKFKDMSDAPWLRERWHRWIDREKTTNGYDVVD